MGDLMSREEKVKEVLQKIADQKMTVEEGFTCFQMQQTEDLGFAQVDHQRSDRQGFPEVVYCEGKTEEQSLAILERLASQNDQVLGTRASESLGKKAEEKIPGAQYHPLSRMIVIEKEVLPKDPDRYILVVAAGTSDLPVAEEACLTAGVMGNRVETLYDVGVAGIHRLFSQLDIVRKANVLIVVAGMEGALPSVVGGLVSQPIVAVPTSVGYGASFGGVAALLGMLNSCAPGIGVVNIDNGFGAGRLAHIINQMR